MAIFTSRGNGSFKLTDWIHSDNHKLIDTPGKVRMLIEALLLLRGSWVCYLDLTGTRPCEDSVTSVLSLYLTPPPSEIRSFHCLYTVDICALGSSAFTTCLVGDKTMSLKGFLEARNTPIVVFEAKRITDRLSSHFGVNVKNVKELQLMECATLGREKDDLYDFGTLMARDWFKAGLDLPWIESWTDIHLAANKSLDPLEGGTLHDYCLRPLTHFFVAYCVKDVLCFPNFHRLYGSQLVQQWDDMSEAPDGPEKELLWWRVADPKMCSSREPAYAVQEPWFEPKKMDLCLGYSNPKGPMGGKQNKRKRKHQEIDPSVTGERTTCSAAT
ncbi:hypothetical protein P152DRAFT_451432 [Eremomyces bilateralis CBS 781.70]|uniref:3'-5' exonuclease domain-containing protein n=1 Tax=Eremomyces bilateralis CBS 781.70 TaxID=1392243 RepID=A0A6G1FWI8_9PEZI|nr:uncharacterized protein P152DRAFT_451432 [Eremomyces bilateralis CBS 781.70]KAF1810051.1 hypothetical protein P152DRAFT_451432 [Eremomyces bilateralis CBS 781.70]